MTGVFMISTIAVRAVVGIKASIAVEPRTAPALMTDGAAAAMTGVGTAPMTGADVGTTTGVGTGATTGADMEAATINRGCLPG
jgi:hypothetical protein